MQEKKILPYEGSLPVISGLVAYQEAQVALASSGLSVQIQEFAQTQSQTTLLLASNI